MDPNTLLCRIADVITDYVIELELLTRRGTFTGLEGFALLDDLRELVPNVSTKALIFVIGWIMHEAKDENFQRILTREGSMSQPDELILTAPPLVHLFSYGHAGMTWSRLILCVGATKKATEERMRIEELKRAKATGLI